MPAIPLMLALFLSQASPAAPATPGSSIVSFVPFILIFVIMYFIMIRPQQRRTKEQQQRISTLRTGDRVVTSSGIHGLIANVKESTVIVKVADNVKIEMDKASIASIGKTNETAA